VARARANPARTHLGFGRLMTVPLGSRTAGYHWPVLYTVECSSIGPVSTTVKALYRYFEPDRAGRVGPDVASGVNAQATGGSVGR